jgi:CRISPR-associated endonuclease Cas1
MTKGISISSDAIYYCMDNKIPIDFFDHTGKHYASILAPISVQKSFWQMQTNLSSARKIYLSTQIITGKLKNQLNLIKYFHKYHKADLGLTQIYESVSSQLSDIITKIKSIALTESNYKEILMGHEAQGAILYWSYIRQLLLDDGIDFKSRERKGVIDLLNSLLNYGYAIIYARIWQAVLKAKLNPSIGYLHAYQQGKPTLVYDIIELFRAQAVDRIVISLIQKREPLSMNNHLLSDDTKKLLVQNILERIHRYEKYRSRNIRFSDIIKEQIQDISLYISGETNTFKPYIAKW